MGALPDPVGPVITLQTTMRAAVPWVPVDVAAPLLDLGVPPLLTPPVQEALRKAVKEVESASSAELVVVVRKSSGRYRHIDMVLGMIAAFATLAFLLYSPWPFAWHYLLVLPCAVVLPTATLCSRSSTLKRALSSQATMDKLTTLAARAAFVEAGVHHTQYRSGVLVFVSLLERSLVLVADSGVELALPKQELDDLSRRLNDSLQAGKGASELAALIESSADLFAKHLPASDEDSNEIPDGVVS